VLQMNSPGFAVLRKKKRISLLRRLPGWTIAGVVTSGTVGAAATSGIGQEEINGTTTSGDGLAEAITISGDGLVEAAATTGVVETNGTTTTTTISGDGREEAAATTGVEVARTMTGVAGNHP